MTRKLLLTIITGILVLGGLMMIFSLNGEKQRRKEEEMIAIATSDEAKRAYEKGFVLELPNATTVNSMMTSYEIDYEKLQYNPMGGLQVVLVINSDEDLRINYNLIDNGDGTYHSAYYSYSPQLAELLEEKFNE